MLIFVLSFSNSDIYLASRTLYGLAKDGQAPKLFTRTTKHGVPYAAVIASSLFIGLAFLNTSQSASVVFGYFVSLTTVLGAVNWANVLLSYFNFLHGIRAQGLSRANLPWRGMLQPYGAYYSAVITLLVIISNGWEAFVPKFDGIKFAVAYCGVAVWIINILGFKYWSQTQYVAPRAMDLQSNVLTVAELNAEDAADPKVKLSFFGRTKAFLWGE
ncbi:hypothetical protein PENPOL_c001G08541 [Penicillium polonicum]|uniref:Amino acid permease/ SLC12A domain-containing protein n=1 Tax=Penicillium polonicum TaxID=60169 RepID=A0A1V6P3K0_PENPO|nr:hypothetical protein PENPOL_c001G08541 [Penicillium polonicum]